MLFRAQRRMLELRSLYRLQSKFLTWLSASATGEMHSLWKLYDGLNQSESVTLSWADGDI